MLDQLELAFGGGGQERGWRSSSWSLLWCRGGEDLFLLTRQRYFNPFSRGRVFVEIEVGRLGERKYGVLGIKGKE